MMQYIEISKIYPHPDNPRKDLGDLTELAESIKANGILQNLTVIPYIGEVTGEILEGKYRVIIGHRRLAAAKLAGLAEVPCMVSDMKLREQVATMLTENIQRSDLTIYEQAQGFQMMLNFGDSVNDISGRTGFSETTVRRRVKLLALDSEKFRQSVERGATLLDYAELDKIKDNELKNSVLDKIGTPNFQYELQRAIDKERSEENKVKLVEQLEQFAAEIDEKASREMGLRYVGGYSPSRDNKVTVPDDAGTTEYFYVVSDYGYIGLYTKHVQGDGRTMGHQESEEQKRNRERRAALDEIEKRAYQLRCDFVREISNAKAKSNMGTIIQYSLRSTLDSYNSVDCDGFVSFLGEETGIGEEDEFEFNDILGFIEKQPERCLLVATYLALDSEHQSYYTWEGQYEKDGELDTVYDFLEAIGYEMSDEERALRDGTHELYCI